MMLTLLAGAFTLAAICLFTRHCLSVRKAKKEAQLRIDPKRWV
jgi:hypothetical protein